MSRRGITSALEIISPPPPITPAMMAREVLMLLPSHLLPGGRAEVSFIKAVLNGTFEYLRERFLVDVARRLALAYPGSYVEGFREVARERYRGWEVVVAHRTDVWGETFQFSLGKV